MKGLKKRERDSKESMQNCSNLGGGITLKDGEIIMADLQRRKTHCEIRMPISKYLSFILQ
jgi:hypothetical protein